MIAARLKKLSWLLGLYLLISIIVFSSGLLLWTYRNAVQAIDQELQRTFRKRHTIAEIILGYQLEIVNRQLWNISSNEFFASDVSKGHQMAAEKILYEILDANPEYQLDITFISLAEDVVWIDANSPFYDFSPILGDIMDREHDLLSSGYILRFQKASVDLTLMLKAAPIIHHQTGKVLGTLFGGIVLNDNLSFLGSIQQKTETKALVLFENGQIIGSTDRLDADSTRTLLDARKHGEAGEIYNANGLLSTYAALSLSGRPTTLQIAMAIPDDSLDALQHAYLKQGGVLLLLSVLFLLISFLSVRWLTQPSLKKLMDYFTSVSAGNLQARYVHGVVTEFNQFGQAAERMVEKIRIGIEERMQAEQALKELNAELDQRVKQRTAQLEAANQAKSVFLANMSHELRTPLNAILGFAQLIANSSSLPEEHKEHIRLINRSGEHLLALINQVLDMSKIEAGRAILKEHAFNLYTLISEIEQSFRPRAESKGLGFCLDVASTVPDYMMADEIKLRQILINLLSNAIKYTPQGTIALKVDVKTTMEMTSGEDGEGQFATHRLWFGVEDSGPGIAAGDLDQIFEAFVQTAEGRQQPEGTGLGLTLSKQLAELMGGQLSVQSTVGRGSVFNLELPLRVADADLVQPQAVSPQIVGLESGQPRYRILVVDDEEICRHLVADILIGISSMDEAEPGFDVQQAANGRNALQIWQQWQPHLIWMDMRMPVMDGFETTRRIKATSQGKDTIIIGLSASAFEDQRSAVLEVGCNDFMCKPFRISDFLHMIHKHLGVRYLYKDTQLADETVRADKPVDMGWLSASLSNMPVDIVIDLRHAVAETNPEKTQAIIKLIARQNPALATELSKFAANFRFDLLSDLLEKNQ